MTTEETTPSTLGHELRAVRAHLLDAEAAADDLIRAAQPKHRYSARNLVHYVALRQNDHTDLQDRLASLGLTSLTRVDADVLLSLDTVIETVDALDAVRPRAAATLVPMEGTELLRRRRHELLGPRSIDRTTRIMVTLPSEAATDPDLVNRFRSAGMDIARVNLAHDDEAAWRTMAARAREAGALVATDLAGPKVRTGPLAEGPKVVKVKPTRDASGVVTEPVAVVLVDADQAAPDDRGTRFFGAYWPIGAFVPVHGLDAAQLERGSTLQMVDARGSRRLLEVVAVTETHVTVVLRKTAYFVTGGRIEGPRATELTVGELPPLPSFHTVSVGDAIVLTRSLEAQEPTAFGTHTIGCTLTEVIDDAQPGDRVFFDDGKIAGVVETKRDDDLVIRVQRSRPGGVKLRAEKGINVPDTTLRVPALTADDLAALPFAAANADIINLSFVRTPDDVADLIRRLRELDAEHVGIVLKIENEHAFNMLPQLLLATMHWDRIGVMIARGDLAVELGFEKLAEVQEEMLRLCEAAHVPVIWATQVLDTLARTGLPSRAEVTDAAMGRRAEAVMLNKGPFVEQAIGALAEILASMTDVMSKQRLHMPALEHWSLEERDAQR